MSNVALVESNLPSTVAVSTIVVTFLSLLLRPPSARTWVSLFRMDRRTTLRDRDDSTSLLRFSSFEKCRSYVEEFSDSTTKLISFLDVKSFGFPYNEGIDRRRHEMKLDLGPKSSE